MNRQIVNRRYRIERKIGEGGAGAVYLAFDIVLNRRVAVKMLDSRLAANRAFRLRFEREAQATANLSHPNIIAIFDVGEQQAEPYIVMEYVEGQTLKEIIEEEGPFHPDDVAVLVEQVASALDYAHGRGIVHRDVKPQNILVDGQGLAKVVDFGIAKALNESSLTSTGTGLGTVHYISPEQASGLMATPESDIYSLGVIAFEMLTGRLPFEADSAIGIALRHLNDPVPDPAEINPDVPPEAADIVIRALEKNPARRFPTAGAFAHALTNWREYAAPPRPPSRPAPQPLAFDPGAQTTRLPAATRSTATPPRTAPEEPRPVAPAPVLPAKRRRPASWLGGAVAVAAIAGLLAYGLGAFDGNAGDDRVSPTATSRSAAGAPTATSEATRPALVFPTGDTGDAAATVPELIGRPEAEARRLVEDAGLVFAVSGRQESDDIAAGSVITQNPTAGSEAEAGGRVAVVISSGGSAIDLAAIPTSGRPWQDVAAELETAGLDVVTIEEGGTVPEGEVIRIDPADLAYPGDAVTLFVSVGDRVRIPVSLQGEQLEIARAELEELGLSIAAEIGVSASTLEANGVDIAAFDIEDGDLVGIQDNGARFGGWIDRGSSVTLVYFDAGLAAPTIAPAT